MDISGEAQDWIFLKRLKGGCFWRGSRVDVSAPDPVSPLGGVADPSPQQQGLGWAQQLNTAKGSWMIQISDPASRFQRSGVQDCKPSADTAEQTDSASAEPWACEGRL